MSTRPILDGTQKLIVSPSSVEADNRYGASAESLQFAFCGQEGPDGNIPNPWGFATCRESLQSTIEQEVLKSGESKKLPVDKGRFALKINFSNEDLLAKSIAALHLYESTYGIPLSLCFRIGVHSPGLMNKDYMKAYDTKVKLFYLVTSRKWIKSSYMASLLMLMVRAFYVGARHIPDAALESIDKFREFTKTSNFNPILALSYIKDTFPHWEFILANYSELFGKFAIEHNWSAQFNGMRDEKTMRYEGVYRLTNPRNSYADKIKKRWEKLHKAPKQEKP